MIVDLDYIEKVKKQFAQINAEDIESIEWVKNGKSVKLTKEQIDEFKYTGFNNTDIDLFGFSFTENKEG